MARLPGKTLGEQLRAFADKTGEKLEDVDLGFKFSLFNRAVMLTPVDTGRLRGNWQITNGAPATGTFEAFDESVEGMPLDQSAKNLIQPFTVTYMTNNLPYARVQEGNYAMVSRAIANARAALRKAVADAQD